MNADYLRQVLDYNPETGIFTWKYREGASARCNTVYAGKKAGCIDKASGYFKISIDDVAYRGHQLAWLYMTGKWPVHGVDHRDLCKSNNVWTNLREATSSQNQCNTKKPSDNTSGFKGVTRSKAGGKPWQAQIQFEGEYKYLGRYDTPEEAHAAYYAAAIKIYGEFARAE